MNKKLASYKNPDPFFLVLRNKDSGDCMTTKDSLLREAPENKKARTLIRIACHELESFYLGDLEAVGKGMGINTGNIINDAMCRNPDGWQTPNNNSHSFNLLIEGIKTLIGRLE